MLSMMLCQGMQLLVVALVGISIDIPLRIAISSLIAVLKSSLVFGLHPAIAVLVAFHAAEEALVGVDMAAAPMDEATIATEAAAEVEVVTSEAVVGSQEIMVGVIKMDGPGSGFALHGVSG